MPGRLHELLRGEHAGFDDLLRRALAGPEALDREAYASFRKGLLRHIGLEEKLLIPQARRLQSPGALRLVEQLRADHAALAALLVPTPTRELVGQLEAVLREHNPLEEDPGGLYEICEQAVGPALDELLQRLRGFPEVPAAAHSDGPRVHQRIERLLRARLALRGDALPTR
jgi:hypothetical protein